MNWMNINFDTFFKSEHIKFTQFHGDFRMFAIAFHHTQMYGAYPYSYHLAFVERTLDAYSFNEYEYKAAAWTHDVVEDTDCEITTVAQMFGETVASYTWACTGEGKNRKERAACIYERLKKVPKAAPVKVADRLVNVRYGLSTENINKLSMYVKEHADFTANVKPLMMEDRRSALLWADLDTAIEYAKELIKCRQKQTVVSDSSAS